jgi:predicted thioesterase
VSAETEIETKAGMGVKHVGPVEMLSTPAMIGMMEGVCMKMLQDSLEAPQTSVGARVDVRHLAPSPVGRKVRVKATFQRAEGRRYFFGVEAYSGETKIGDGMHERAVVDPSRFKQRPPGQ